MDISKKNIEKGLIILEKAVKKHHPTIDLLSCSKKVISNYLKPKINPCNWDTWRSGDCWVKNLYELKTKKMIINISN